MEIINKYWNARVKGINREFDVLEVLFLLGFVLLFIPDVFFIYSKLNTSRIRIILKILRLIGFLFSTNSFMYLFNVIENKIEVYIVLCFYLILGMITMWLFWKYKKYIY